MKSPDEIKKGLECCLGDCHNYHCEECPYADHDTQNYDGCTDNGRQLSDDALALIQQLEAQNAELLEKVERFSKAAFEQNMVILRKQDIITKQERRRANYESEIWQLKQQVPRWISVEERLPEGEVLAANFAPGTYGYKEYIIGYVFSARSSEPGGCYAESEHETLNNVTHWMPLPEPPKEE